MDAMTGSSVYPAANVPYFNRPILFDTSPVKGTIVACRPVSGDEIAAW